MLGRLVAAALCLGFGLTSAAAQSTQVVPADFASREGETFTSFPFGRSHSTRVQHYFEPRLFAAKGTLLGVAFRPEGGKSYAGKGLELEIQCATSHADVGQLNTLFHANVGSHAATVFSRKILNLPLLAGQAGPQPFGIAFTFDTPFAYDPAQGGLLIDVMVHGQARGDYDLDLGSLCVSAKGTFGQPGCPGSNQKIPFADVPTTAVLQGQPFVFRVGDVPVGSAVGLILGSRESGSWGALTLPFDLGIAGATNCWLNTDLLLLFAAVADAQGEARFLGGVPNSPVFVGFWVRFQGFVLDPAANPFGMTTTQGAKVQVCGAFPVGRVVGSTVSAFGGTVEPGIVPVTELRWQ